MIGLLSYLVFFTSVALIFAVVVLGLNLQWGSTGLFNAGIVGFYAIGAYAFAILTAPPRPELIGNFGLPWLVGLAGAMAASAFAALIIGLATLKLRDDYLAIATFGIASTIQLLALNAEPLTGGAMGIASIPGSDSVSLQVGAVLTLVSRRNQHDEAAISASQPGSFRIDGRRDRDRRRSCCCPSSGGRQRRSMS